MDDYEFYKSIGICTTCKKNAAAPGHTTCSECLRKKREYEKIKYHSTQRNKVTDIQKRAERAKNNAISSKKYRENHKRLGLCRSCAKPATHGRYCEKHWLYNKNYKYKLHKKHWNERDKLEIPEYHGKSKVDIGKLISLHNAGWKNSEIAIEMKISESTVYKFLKLAREQMEEKNELQS